MRPLFLLLIAVLLIGCQRSDPSKGSPKASASPSPAASSSPLKGMTEDTVRLAKTTIKFRQGQKWELEADDVDWYDDRSNAKANNVTWWLLDENDKKWVRVDAPKADVQMDTEVITFVGQTVATRLGFPETLKVQHLVYKGKDRKFYGSGGVIWNRANIQLTGETLTATAELDKVQLKGRVKGKSEGGLKGLNFSEPRKAKSSGEN